MDRVISLGYSPCPNDTFIFHALVHDEDFHRGLRFSERLEDVQTLNDWARLGRLDVTKLSFHAIGHIRDRYTVLRCGAALGRGCGPLLVARDAGTLSGLAGRSIALPGTLTTAALLLRLAAPRLWETAVMMPFHEIPDAVANGRVDAGVIIHESRFTYAAHGLVEVADLGRWWENETGLPIPLGGIAARRDLGVSVIGDVEAALRESVRRARANPQTTWTYVKRHAQETADDVIRHHIDLYVNDSTEWLGEEGEAAVRELLARAEAARIIPASTAPLFAE